VLFFLCHAVQFLNSVKSVGYLQVVAKMRDMVSNDTQNPVSNSFLLDDDLSIPFTTEEIAEEVPDVDMSNIEMPSSLRHVHSAQFLMQHLQSSYLSR